MNRLSRYYVKFIVKNSWLFYGFICLGVGLFVALSLAVEVDTIKTYNGSFSNGRIYIDNGAAELDQASQVYVYTDRNVRVYHILISEEGARIRDADLFVFAELGNSFYVDVPVGKETLLHRIFAKAGKSL